MKDRNWQRRSQLDEIDGYLKEIGELNEDARGAFMVDDLLNMKNKLSDVRTEILSVLPLIDDLERNLNHC